MMDINRKNYEVFAIDFVEGALSPADSAEFLAFLADNPDIANEVELLRENAIGLPVENHEVDFSFLKKDLNTLQISEDNFDEMCIAYHEGDLDSEAQKQLLQKLEEDEPLKARFELYGQLFVVPDTSVVFPGKSSLKQRKLPVMAFRRVSIATIAVAASIALFLVFRAPERSQNMFVGSIDNTIASFEKILQTQETLQNTEEIVSPPEETATPKKVIHKKPVYTQPEESEILVAEQTQEPPREEFNYRLSRIEASEISNNNIVAELSIKTPAIVKAPDAQKETVIEEFRYKGNQLFTKASKITVTDIIKTGINGINQMAETDLKYEAVTDKDGNVVEYALSSETFNIKRKTKRN